MLKKYVCLLLLLLICFTGCSNNEEENLKLKVQSEIDYFETEIFSIAVKYAKGEFYKSSESNEKVLDWDGIYSEVRKLNSSWDSVALDLNKMKIASENINNLSIDISNLIIAISQQNENEMFNSLNEMYSILPNIEQKFLDENASAQKRLQKSIILSSYRYCINNDFENAEKESSESIENYLKLMETSEYVKENIYSLNKVYIGLVEYDKAIKTQNIGLINIRLINLIEEL